ncbi:hypothetical protein [Nitratireductor sp. GCM10026969]|uniref:hypothetical protein n=1 Tax=Nitratireductor sp. GCM10026969 TaxID=3252645 RepID=UPI003621ACA4
MGEWIDYSRWPECPAMERPGLVFEVRNGQGQVMLTRCEVPLPMPFDWTSAPVRFRVIEEPKPRHSTPIPPPRG